jgi:hypothetical protein
MKSRAFILIASAVFAVASMFAQEKPQEKKDPAAEKKKADKNELPLEMPKKLEFEHRRGHVDFARCHAGRPESRIRAAW